MTLLIVGTVSAVTIIPSCDFTASTTSGIEDLTVIFTASYEGIIPPVTYEWDFGDDSGALKVSGNSITHVYNNPGTYTVRLAVNDLGVPTTWWVSNTKTDYIHVFNTPPTVSITADPTSGPADLRVNFSSTVTGEGIISYIWDFGDGHMAPRDGQNHILPSASNIYESNGTVLARLTVTNDGGSTTSDPVEITIYPEIPQVDFVGSPLIGKAPMAVQFAGISNQFAYVNDWYWDFGDGQHSSEQNPLHAYGTVGLKTVTLTASNGYNSDTETKVAYINVTAENPEVCPPIVIPEIYPDNVAIFRPSTGYWYFDTDGDRNSDVSERFGKAGDIPVTGDFNGDLITDIGIFRPSTGYWYIDENKDGIIDDYEKFGSNGDIPVPADYNGDGVTDIAIFRPSDGNWYIDTDFDGAVEIVPFRFGSNGDFPFAGVWDTLS